MKLIKFILTVAACIYAALFCMAFGIELYKRSPDFRRGYDIGKMEQEMTDTKKSNIVGFKNKIVVKGIGY